jgi:hypothetical protein
MTTPEFPTMTCAAFQAMLPDYLEEHALGPATRDAADIHLAGCADCAALVNDLRAIVRSAADLPLLSPGRELWSGIEARIEAPVVALPAWSKSGEVAPAETGGAAPVATGPATIVPWRHFGVAASLLVAATAGITWALTMRASTASVARDPAVASRSAPDTAPVGAGGISHVRATVTFDREIEALRKLMDERRNELDPITVGVVEKNLKVIDHAISESKAALANDPASAFLMDRLTRAYDSKLQLMRELAMRPPRS